VSVAIAAVLPRQFDDVGCQPFGIFSAPRDLALRRAVLPDRIVTAAHEFAPALPTGLSESRRPPVR